MPPDTSKIDNRCGLVDPDNPCRCGRQIASGVAAGVIDGRRLPFARHPRQEPRMWIEPVAKQLDAVVAIGDLYRSTVLPLRPTCGTSCKPAFRRF